MNYNLSDMLSAEDKIKHCTEDDIDSHFETVLPLVQSTDRSEYKKLMLQAVNEDTAYQLLDGSCFLYYLKEEQYTARGVSFYGKDNPVGLLVLFAGIFDKDNEETVLLRFIPHSNDEIKDYKSLLTVSSIKKWHKAGTYVSIRVDKLINKTKKVLLKRVA